MDSENVSSLFSSLSPMYQMLFLVKFGHELTILAREYYPPDASIAVSTDRLRLINEVQHRALSHLSALLANDADRYPDKVLVDILLDQQDDAQLRAGVRKAFERTLDSFLTVGV